MGHYRANLRDIEFNLFEFLGRGEILGQGMYEAVDAETARDILAEVERLATNELAESFFDADRHPPVFDPATSTVTTPESFKRSYRAYVDSEWWRMDLPPQLGGIVVPPSLRWAAQELVLGANPAVHMFAIGPAFAHLLWRNGTPDQKRLAQLMVDRRWGATMMLTEPDAGSDVGAGRAKAVRQPDGTWHIEGVKRFITSGEHDLADNIVHFVLARPEGHGPGTKGLSLFVVPKFLVDLDTGELTARNGVYATNLERKMGLKASTTCEMRFGERLPAVGTLLGDRHDGIAQMFQIIENARMMVGTKAIATLSTGYRHAVEFARTRVQGPDLTQAADKSAPKVTIIHHPEVRRSLMLQKAYAEGMRALVCYTASIQDGIYADRLGGLPPDLDAVRQNRLLLPIVKGVGSERSYALLGDALQVLGGSGFLQDYPVEQYIRDAKIDTLYEGTTAIQAMDLFFRKIVRDDGAAFTALTEQIQEFAKGDAGNGALGAERDRLARALDDVRGILAAMVGALTGAAGDPTKLYQVGQNTTPLLLATGDLVIGWLLLRQAEVALRALPTPAGRSGRDRAFYEGKVAAARFFAHRVLPTLSAQRVIAESVDDALMAVSEEAF
jgi:alkylation response protein AidB-like acyl-CoA dehydrogenase